VARYPQLTLEPGFASSHVVALVLDRSRRVQASAVLPRGSERSVRYPTTLLEAMEARIPSLRATSASEGGVLNRRLDPTAGSHRRKAVTVVWGVYALEDLEF
jgi:hypothetical protein